jgi:hypothetical protein
MDRPLLLKVEDLFQLSERGLVLTPELAVEVRDRFKNGDVVAVELVRSDGASTRGTVHLWYEHHRPGGYKMMCFLDGMSKEEIPVGTEVWALLP